MTREILFRGKRTDTGEWVEGFILNTFDERYQSQSYLDVPPRTWQIWDLNGRLYSVHPSTVGQFTGLLDKDGNKIFEGDVISRDGYYDKIVFCDGVQMLTYSANNPQRVFALTKNSIDKLDYVSGNIHDNPELLHP